MGGKGSLWNFLGQGIFSTNLGIHSFHSAFSSFVSIVGRWIVKFRYFIIFFLFKGELMIIRKCTVEDVDSLRRFVDRCKPLELHTPFTYWTLFNYFSNICFLMIEKDELIGFISGIKGSLDKEVVYLWQIGVSKSHRGKNYASVLIDNFIKAVIELDCNKIQVSISPDNEASYNTFLKYAKEHSYNFAKIGEVKYNDQLSDKKEYEILYQIEI